MTNITLPALGRSARRIASVAALGLGLAALLSPAAGAEPPAVLDAALAERITVPLAELPGRVPLGPVEAFRVVEIGRDANSSHHVVAIREREQPHRHDRHDLIVVMLRGHGGMQLGAEERPVGVGSILYVPRGTIHAYRNASEDIAYAYAIYTPAFDGQDRVMVEPEEPLP